MSDDLRARLRSAWAGRVSGCQLGKPVELLSMRHGHEALTAYLTEAGALPLRDYVPLVADSVVARQWPQCCRGRFDRSEPDDDINYSVLALMLLERHGADLTTADVARGWLQLLPGGMVFTAERAAYVMLLERAGYGFAAGAEPALDLAECSDNEFNDWIGAQIRADVYGWVCPGRPDLAADLARRDAELSHRAEGVYGAMFVAALGAALAGGEASLDEAIDRALACIPPASDCAEAVTLGRAEAAAGRGPEAIHRRYAELSPVHTVNNLALVVWGLVAGADDFGRAVGDTVAAGWDTDCNGATVGGLWGLRQAVPDAWTDPWNGRIGVTLAGVGELALDDLVERTVAVADALADAEPVRPG